MWSVGKGSDVRGGCGFLSPLLAAPPAIGILMFPTLYCTRTQETKHGKGAVGTRRRFGGQWYHYAETLVMWRFVLGPSYPVAKGV